MFWKLAIEINKKKHLKINVLLILNNIIIFTTTKRVCRIHSPLPVSKYERMWTAHKVILNANLIVQTQTISQNAQCVPFLQPQVVFIQEIFKGAKVFEMGLVYNIEICEKT